jgi:hypothetical protein
VISRSGQPIGGGGVRVERDNSALRLENCLPKRTKPVSGANMHAKATNPHIRQALESQGKDGWSDNHANGNKTITSLVRPVVPMCLKVTVRQRYRMNQAMYVP